MPIHFKGIFDEESSRFDALFPHPPPAPSRSFIRQNKQSQQRIQQEIPKEELQKFPNFCQKDSENLRLLPHVPTLGNVRRLLSCLWQVWLWCYGCVIHNHQWWIQWTENGYKKILFSDHDRIFDDPKTLVITHYAYFWLQCFLSHDQLHIGPSSIRSLQYTICKTYAPLNEFQFSISGVWKVDEIFSRTKKSLHTIQHFSFEPIRLKPYHVNLSLKDDEDAVHRSSPLLDIHSKTSVHQIIDLTSTFDDELLLTSVTLDV